MNAVGLSPIHGKSILVVEDEVIIGLMLCKELESAGAIPVGPLTSVADALKEIESRPVDVVLLDAKLVGGSAAGLVACLDERRIPYVVVSGYERSGLPAGLRAAPFVSKPVVTALLIEAIESLARTPERRPPPSSLAGPLAPMKSR